VERQHPDSFLVRAFLPRIGPSGKTQVTSNFGDNWDFLFLLASPPLLVEFIDDWASSPKRTFFSSYENFL